jgi:hypothetical protein
MGNEIQACNKGCSWRMDNENKIWKTVWDLNVQNVVKHFLWWACNNLLPTNVNLFRRGVVNNKIFPLCEDEEEIVIHALWSCLAPQDVWSCGPIIFQKMCSWGESLVVVFSTLHAYCDQEDLAMWAVISRRIWFRRNSVVYNGSFTHPDMVYREALLVHEEYKLCNFTEEQAVLLGRELETMGQILWQPPPV